MRVRRLGSSLLSGMVLVAALGFLMSAASVTWSGEADVVEVRSVFSSSSGLRTGSDVALAGVVVGKVVSVALDARSDLSVVTFTRPRSLKLPSDTELAIEGGGPAGSATLSIVPGRSARMLQAGLTITRTAPARSLEDDIGDFIFGDGGLGGAE